MAGHLRVAVVAARAAPQLAKEAKPFDGLVSLYVISAMFGLFQGGIVPSYTIIVREHFPAHEAGYRIGFVLFATLVGMALGGWSSGRIFDLTGSYHAAFLHGIGWNLVNGGIVIWLLWRFGRPRATYAHGVTDPVGAR